MPGVTGAGSESSKVQDAEDSRERPGINSDTGDDPLTNPARGKAISLFRTIAGLKACMHNLSATLDAICTAEVHLMNIEWTFPNAKHIKITSRRK